MRATFNRTTLGHAGLAMWRTMAIGSVVMLMMVLFNGYVAGIVAKVSPGPALTVDLLEFRDGRLWQLVRTTDGSTLRGTWSAGINGGSDFICAGGGTAPYFGRTRPVPFTPDNWTLDDCSGLVPGETYTARATWEWLGLDGKIGRVSAQTEFTWEPQP